MNNIKYWQEKIKEKNKLLDFRDFLMTIGSWCPLNFYRRNGLITRFPNTDRVSSIVSMKQFESTRNDLENKDYDLEKTFFENFKNLLTKLDLGNLIDYGGNENAKFSDMTLNSKNVYISFGIINNCENILYGFSVKDNSKDIINGLGVWNSSNIVYQSSGVIQSFKIFYSRNIKNSSEIWFSSNLTGCKDCIFCDDLQNQKYCINNKQLEKKEYLEQKEIILKKKKKFTSFYNKVNKVGTNVVSDNVTGSYIVESNDIENGYYCSNVNKGRNLVLVGGVNGDENMYNVFAGGSPKASDFYGVMGANGENLYSSVNIVASNNIFYSYFMENCSYCIGCSGLKNKNYCILNKQYSKEEWEILADKIFSGMEKEGVLGDFFPGFINPFFLNDSMAGLLGNFTKKEVEKKGYMWRDNVIKVDIPEGSEVIKYSDLDGYEGYDENGNWKINPDIMKKVIIGRKGHYYKIIKMEYDFLVKYGLPLPEYHWHDRMKQNLGV